MESQNHQFTKYDYLVQAFIKLLYLLVIQVAAVGEEDCGYASLQQRHQVGDISLSLDDFDDVEGLLYALICYHWEYSSAAIQCRSHDTE
jgi:hypothetical protein